MECSDPAYHTAAARVALDRAAATRCGTTVPRRHLRRPREDDGTTVEDNTFTAPDATHHAVVIGTPCAPRSSTVRCAHAVRNNIVDIAGNMNPYRWVHGEEARPSPRATPRSAAPTGICAGRAGPCQRPDLRAALHGGRGSEWGRRRPSPLPRQPRSAPRRRRGAPLPHIVPGTGSIAEGGAGDAVAPPSRCR